MLGSFWSKSLSDFSGIPDYAGSTILNDDASLRTEYQLLGNII